MFILMLTEYAKGTYFEVGAAVALTMAAGGPRPWIFSDFMSKAVALGGDGRKELEIPLSRHQCLKMKFIDISTSEEISRVSVTNYKRFAL